MLALLFLLTLYLVTPYNQALEQLKDGGPKYERSRKPAIGHNSKIALPAAESALQPERHLSISPHNLLLWPSFGDQFADQGAVVRNLPALGKGSKAWISPFTVTVTPTCVAPAAGVASLTPCALFKRSASKAPANVESSHFEWETIEEEANPRILLPWLLWPIFKVTSSTTSSTSTASVTCIPPSLSTKPLCPVAVTPCSSNADCSGSTPICDGATKVCLPRCTDNSQCVGATPVCQTSTGQCVGCNANADCSDPSLPACDSQTNACVKCVIDSQCLDTNLPFCSATTKTCVECKQDTNCPSNKQFCDVSLGSCSTSCSTNGQCTTAFPGTPFCLKGQCVECISGPDCTSPTPYCDPSNNRCSSTCTVNEQCAYLGSSAVCGLDGECG